MTRFSEAEPPREPAPAPGAEELPTVSIRDAAAGPGRLLSPGQILGRRYQIRAFLGEGGMGEVWLAFDLRLRVEVALKSVRRERLGDERAVELLRHEVRAARVVASPNVCRIFDLMEAEGLELVSMEYVDGTTLAGVLRRRAPLDLREASEIAAQFLAGLEAIHQAGLVHRDVKPENIMLTRAGRVVLMDFGLARPEAGQKSGTVSGTPAYMAPEQARGERLDARADLFAAGLVLAEMIDPAAARDAMSRQAFLHDAHQEPPRFPEGPWRPVLLRAAARDPAHRYPSAQALIRALQEATLRVAGADDVRPYPGLAAFSEADAEYFFGREVEVEQMWRRLRWPHLQAIIGPSGAGKSSFLHAGLIPALPEGWRCIACAPGRSPMLALAQALAPELSGDTEAVRELLRFEDPDIAVGLIGRWRRGCAEALLVVDQFEELFTLNAPEVQARFADLLGRLGLEADVHVLLSLRDDFLFHCHAHPALAPIFSELAPLGPPTGAALHRALVQPALKCGYRFEDEALVEEMLAGLREERGALPLLAFAAARMWEKRDRETGLLTRAVYQEIGGVAGALAQHAEATLERIGEGRLPAVREIFRNLVTAQGTRVARAREELLSVFPDRGQAEEVLSALIDARLLTSFEVREGEGEGIRRSQRVEIVHESLLAAWPRLVRWQSQDADGALLRDQLRQGAQMWEERGRPEDLLWSGTAYRDFALWRERYPGGLTATEEAFARAMVARAGRRRRNVRLAVASAFVVLIGVLGVIGFQVLRERAARLRAEASRFLALGQLEIDSNPTSALALSLASLERADTPEARRFALEAFWRGPAYMTFASNDGTGGPPGLGEGASVAFSPDGRWLAAGQLYTGRIALFSAAGGPPRVLNGPAGHVYTLVFGPESDVLLSNAVGTNAVQVWSIPGGELIRSLEYGLKDTPHRPRFVSANRSRMITESVEGRGSRNTTVRFLSWSPASHVPVVLGDLRGITSNTSVDSAGTLLAYIMADDVYVRSLDDLEEKPPRFVGHQDDVVTLAFDKQGMRLASGDSQGGIRVWSLDQGAKDSARIFNTEERVDSLEFDPTGSWLASGHTGGAVRLWDLSQAAAFPPFEQIGPGDRIRDLAFHPGGRWLASAPHTESARLWRLGVGYPRVLYRARGGGFYASGVVFAPDGRWLAATVGEDRLRLWPLDRPDARPEEIRLSTTRAFALAVDSGGRRILVGEHDGVELVPLQGGPPRKLVGFKAGVAAVGLSPDGRYAAAGGGWAETAPSERFIRVWDLQAGTFRDLRVEQEVMSLFFLPDCRILFLTGSQTGGSKDLYRWDINEESAEMLKKGITRYYGTGLIDLSRDGNHLLVPDKGGMFLHDLRDGSVRRIETGAGVCLFGTPETLLVCGHEDGIVRIVDLQGGAGYDLVGHQGVTLVGHQGVTTEAHMSPDGRWIASSGWDGELRLWPMPQGEPLSTALPLGQFLDRLRPLTNQRAVVSDGSPKGWTITLDPPYPGWEIEQSAPN